MNETHTEKERNTQRTKTTTTTMEKSSAQESPSFPSNQLRHQSSFHRWFVCFCVRRSVVLCSNHFSVFRLIISGIVIMFTCSEHNNRTCNKTTIMKIEIKTWGSQDSLSLSLVWSWSCYFVLVLFSLYLSRSCLSSVSRIHLRMIQIDAQRKQWLQNSLENI